MKTFALVVLAAVTNLTAAPAALAAEKVAQCRLEGFKTEWRYRVSKPFWVSPRLEAFLNLDFGSNLRVHFDEKTGVAGTYEERNSRVWRTDVTPLLFEGTAVGGGAARARFAAHGDPITLHCQVIETAYVIVPTSTIERPFALRGEVRWDAVTSAGSSFAYEWAQRQYRIAGSLEAAALDWNLVRGPALGERAEVKAAGLLVHGSREICDEYRDTSEGPECVHAHSEAAEYFYSSL